ncbi:MAG: BrnA antitoxin family protein [Pseudomonadota bacterium]|nr:BrnA antitoxin family protein [Pseudomonadota bacterium]
MQVKSESGRIFDLPSDEEETKISEGIAYDLDTHELSEQESRRLRPLGRPKAEVTKERITIRLSPEVVETFRATGEGWQSRMDKALRDYLKTHSQSEIEGL